MFTKKYNQHKQSEKHDKEVQHNPWSGIDRGSPDGFADLDARDLILT